MPNSPTPITITVDVESEYAHDSGAALDEHTATIALGGVPVFRRVYTELPDRHHGDHGWDPADHFGQMAAGEFGVKFARLMEQAGEDRLD